MSDPLDSANKIIEILNQHTSKEAATILHAVSIQVSEYVLTARFGPDVQRVEVRGYTNSEATHKGDYGVPAHIDQDAADQAAFDRGFMKEHRRAEHRETCVVVRALDPAIHVTGDEQCTCRVKAARAVNVACGHCGQALDDDNCPSECDCSP